MQKKTLRKIILTSAAGSIFIPSVVAAAANTAAPAIGSPEFNLAEEIITATKTPQKLAQANADVTVITAKQIEQHHYKNAFDAISTAPGVTVAKYAPIGYTSMNALYLNGSSNIVVCVDGIKKNIPGCKGAQILSMYDDMENIKRIEILHGAASTLYGADAEGGVINIITKKVKKPATIIKGSYGNFNTAKYSLETQGLSDDENFSYRLFYQGNKQGNYRDGKGITWDSHQHDSTAAVELDQKLNGGLDDLNFSFNQTKYTSKYHALWEPSMFADYAQKNYAFTWQHEFDATANNQLSLSRNSIENNFISYNNRLKLGSINFSDQFNKKLDKHLLSIGFEHNKNTADSKVSYEATTNSLYLQDQYKADEHLSFTSGIRYTHSTLFGKHYSPSLSIGYDQGKAHLYASYSDYYLTPDFDSLYNPIWGNKTLKPTSGNTKGFGADYRFDAKSSLAANYFVRHNKNRIYYNFSSSHYANLPGEETISGWNMTFRHVFDSFWSSNFSYAHLNLPKTFNNQLQPRGQYNVGLNYQNRAFEANLTGSGYIDVMTPQLSTPALPTTSYWLWDFNANYKLAPNKSVYLSINNIFDKYYAGRSNVEWGKPGQWWAAPGRTVMVGFKYQF